MSWKSITASAALAGASCLAQTSIQLKVVKGSPFSAQAVTQSTQELADGNRIFRQTTASIARDSDGRTRREQGLQSGNASVVYIQDPLAGLVYILDPQSRSARKTAVAMREMNGAQPEIKNRTPIGREAGGNTKSEALGIQIVEGFVVQGTRLKSVLPPGQAGNEKPLEIVSESWYSDELQTVIQSKSFDPRLGETTYRLTDIRRGEPSHALFEVPGEYLIVENPQTTTESKTTGALQGK